MRSRGKQDKSQISKHRQLVLQNKDREADRKCQELTTKEIN